MNITRFLIGTTQLLPLLAYAQGESNGEQISIWVSLFWTLFPIALVVPVILLVLRRVQKPILKRTEQHMERQVQHMERVEQSLDRIAQLLEKKE